MCAHKSRSLVAGPCGVLGILAAWLLSAAAPAFAQPPAAGDLTLPTLVAVELEDDAQTEQPATPPHTGFHALFRNTVSDYKSFPLRKSTWVILAIGGAVAGAVSPADEEINEHLKDASIGKAFAPGRVLGSTPFQVGAAMGVYIVGRWVIHPPEGKSNKVTHMGFDMLRAILLTEGLTYGIKAAVRRDRPTGECCSFPSGHASVTFATASVLERHFGARAAWPTFAIGGYVAMSRIFDNRHWMSDVLFGSALGIASGWTVVGRHGRNDFALVPLPTRGGMAVSFVWTPGASRSATAAGEP